MAEPVLDQPRVMASIGQGVAAGVAQHVGMDPEWQLGALANGFHEVTASAVNGPPRSVSKIKAPVVLRCSSRSMRNSSPRMGCLCRRADYRARLRSRGSIGIGCHVPCQMSQAFARKRAATAS